MKDLTINVPTMTVKEVADILGVTPEAIKKHVRELFPESIQNGISTRLTDYQVSEIKKHMTPTTSVVGNFTELEMERMTVQVIQYHMNRNAELEAKIAELEPKAETYDLCLSSERLHSIQDLGKITGIGAQKIFVRLAKDGYIYSVISDGDRHYRSYRNYDKYFRPVMEHYQHNGESKTHTKLMLNTEGFMHFCKLYGTTGESEWQ